MVNGDHYLCSTLFQYLLSSICNRGRSHSRPSTTMDIYGHLVPGMQDEAAKMMDGITTLNTVDISQIEEVKKVKEEEGG